VNRELCSVIKEKVDVPRKDEGRSLKGGEAIVDDPILPVKRDKVKNKASLVFLFECDSLIHHHRHLEFCLRDDLITGSGWYLIAEDTKSLFIKTDGE